MKLLIIIGNSSVGKMTVGQELAKITDLKLFHGHMILEPVLEIYGERNTDVELKIRDIIFNDFAKSDNYGLIFTYVMDFANLSYLEHVADIFEKEGADVYYAELVATQEIRLQRNVTENRLKNKPSKRNVERSNLRIINDDKNYRLVSYDGELTFENYIKIDNSYLSPDIVAKMIKERFLL